VKGLAYLVDGQGRRESRAHRPCVACIRPSLLLLCILTAVSVPCFASRTVIDETGRSVTVPDHAHRIVCLTPSITDSVFALGAAHDVVAISDYVDYPAEAKKKPSVGAIDKPSVEMVLSLHPDLILGMPYLNDQAVLQQFERLGIPVYLADPHGIAGILRSLIGLGHALGRESEATTLVARLQQRIDSVRASVKGRPVVSVFMPVSYDPVMTIGKRSFITDIIQAAGGHSITDDLNQEWPRISMEAVIARAPQALLIMRGGIITPEILKTRPGWDILPAVRSGRVYLVDKRVNFPSPVAIDALEDLAKQFHPELTVAVSSQPQPTAGCREARCNSATTP
jgi:iron complex transport system substrate-binding protein